MKSSHSKRDLDKLIQIGQRHQRAHLNYVMTVANPTTISSQTTSKKKKKLKSISLQNGGNLEYIESSLSPRVSTTQGVNKNNIFVQQSQQSQEMTTPGQVYLVPSIQCQSNPSSNVNLGGILKRNNGKNKRSSQVRTSKKFDNKVDRIEPPVSISFSVGKQLVQLQNLNSKSPRAGVGLLQQSQISLKRSKSKGRIKKNSSINNSKGVAAPMNFSLLPPIQDIQAQMEKTGGLTLNSPPPRRKKKRKHKANIVSIERDLLNVSGPMDTVTIEAQQRRLQMVSTNSAIVYSDQKSQKDGTELLQNVNFNITSIISTENNNTQSNPLSSIKHHGSKSRRPRDIFETHTSNFVSQMLKSQDFTQDRPYDSKNDSQEEFDHSQQSNKESQVRSIYYNMQLEQYEEDLVPQELQNIVGAGVKTADYHHLKTNSFQSLQDDHSDSNMNNKRGVANFKRSSMQLETNESKQKTAANHQQQQQQQQSLQPNQKIKTKQLQRVSQTRGGGINLPDLASKRSENIVPLSIEKVKPIKSQHNRNNKRHLLSNSNLSIDGAGNLSVAASGSIQPQYQKMTLTTKEPSTNKKQQQLNNYANNKRLVQKSNRSVSPLYEKAKLSKKHEQMVQKVSEILSQPMKRSVVQRNSSNEQHIMVSKTVENLQERNNSNRQLQQKQPVLIGKLLDPENITVKNNNLQATIEYGGRPLKKIHSNSMVLDRTESEKNLKRQRAGGLQSSLITPNLPDNKLLNQQPLSAQINTLRMQEMRLKQFFERENQILPLNNDLSKFNANNKRISAVNLIQNMENTIRQNNSESHKFMHLGPRDKKFHHHHQVLDDANGDSSVAHNNNFEHSKSNLHLNQQKVVKVKLSDFDLGVKIGAGTFGVIIRATHKQSGIEYALKMISKKQIQSKEHAEHIVRERNVLMYLSQSNKNSKNYDNGSSQNHFIVRAQNAFHDAENIYIQMDFVKGCDLLSRIRANEIGVKNNIQFYVAEVTCAIEHLHNNLIIYRDLKPEHVMIDSEGHCQLVDFGFAKRFHQKDRTKNQMKTYTNCGTPDYIAPEVLRGIGTSFEADIWSLGVFICEIISGRTPFHNDNPQQIYENVINCRPRYAPSVSGLVRTLLKTIFVQDPGFRATIEQIKKHTVFKRIDWTQAQNRQLEAPFIPNVEMAYHNCNALAEVESRAVQPDQQNLAAFAAPFLDNSLQRNEGAGNNFDQTGSPGDRKINNNQFVKLQKEAAMQAAMNMDMPMAKGIVDADFMEKNRVVQFRTAKNPLGNFQNYILDEIFKDF